MKGDIGWFSLGLKLRLSAGQVMCILQQGWERSGEAPLILDCYWYQCSVRYISEWKSARMGSCYEVANSPGIGRYLVATRDIKPLELVLEIWYMLYDILYHEISHIFISNPSNWYYIKYKLTNDILYRKISHMISRWDIKTLELVLDKKDLKTQWIFIVVLQGFHDVLEWWFAKYVFCNKDWH